MLTPDQRAVLKVLVDKSPCHICFLPCPWTLTPLMDAGLVEGIVGRWNAGRYSYFKYAITPAGRKALEEQAPSIGGPQ